MSSSPLHLTGTDPLRSYKRPSPPTDQHGAGAPRKRRSRYAWRACDVCRRRKGRCDGRKPCDFCRSRALDCRYAPEPEAVSGTGPPDDAAVPLTLPTSGPGATRKGESLARLVLALQAQLDSLAAHVEPSNDAHSPPTAPIPSSLPKQSTSLDVPTSALLPNDPPIPSVAAAANTAKKATRRFYGPTSPDYSLNAAEIKLRQAQAPPGGTTLPQEANPSLEDDQTDDDDEHALGPEDDSSSVQSRLTTARLRQCLVQLPRLLTRTETLRLLNVYQDVIGHLHPVLDMKRLVEQAEACYVRPGTDHHLKRAFDASSTQENTILIMFLTLVIALCAETVSQSYVGKTLYKSVEHLIKMKIASDVTSLDHVIIALLAGIRHYFDDETRLAWRTCSVAGRMAMELGLHRREVHQHLLENEKQRAEISALVWSIVVLDRQWSAATGLPQNFSDSDFDQAVEPPKNAVYLRAMISYTFMSPKFEGPIYRVTAGASYEQDDAFEVLNFQIDQWLKKAVEGQNIVHPCPAEAIGVKPTTDHSKQPSAMATLLYLRANAFRSLILRPFFLSSSHSGVGVRMIKPSLAIISDTIGVLTRLDSTTDIYKKQHPFFRHFLSSSCALLFLVVAYLRADQNRSLVMQSADLLEDFSGIVKRELERAVALASAYSTLSQTSYRLSKRLRLLGELLSRSDFLQPAKDLASDRNVDVNTSFSLQQQRSQRCMADKGPWPLDGRSSVTLQENTSNGTGVFADQSDVVFTMDAPGEESLNYGLLDDMEMLWPDWPNNELGGLLAENGLFNP